MYIGVAGNTNAGLSARKTGDFKENYFSGAILVANLGVPGFNGFIKYDAPDNGNPIVGSGFGPNGVEIFAAGLRNPFGVYVHSSGKVYGEFRQHDSTMSLLQRFARLTVRHARH
jgi:hypothetical protein